MPNLLARAASLLLGGNAEGIDDRDARTLLGELGYATTAEFKGAESDFGEATPGSPAQGGVPVCARF